MASDINNHVDGVLINARLATFSDLDYGWYERGALTWKNGRIHWVGAQKDLAIQVIQQATQVIDAQQALVTPGLIDCHTHLVFAGNRAHEYEQRLNGASYAHIAKTGGGIISTVHATREISFDDLLQLSQQRVSHWLSQGITTLEIKSGYGLNIKTEEKILRIIQEIKKTQPINIQATFLGAHAIPPEFHGQADAYIDHVCQMITTFAEQDLIDAVDAFCEYIAFTKEQISRVFECAKQYQLPVKLHAEQLSNMQGTAMATQYQALSTDHLEYTCENSIMAMSHAGTVAVLLPAAFYFLREPQIPPIALFRQHNVPIAIATDFNPGSSPLSSLPIAMNMACQLFGMTPLEAWRGVTINAARALGLHNNKGQLTSGFDADFVIWNATQPIDIVYWLGKNLVQSVWRNGNRVFTNNHIQEPLNHK